MKDDELPEPKVFRIDPFEIFNADKTKSITVPKAVLLDHEETKLAKPANDNRAPKVTNRSVRETEVLRIFEQLHDGDPSAWYTARELDDQTAEAFNKVRNNRDSLRKAVDRAIEGLLAKDLIERQGQRYRFKALSNQTTTESHA